MAEDFRDRAVLGNAQLIVFVGVVGGYLRPIHSAQGYVGEMYAISPVDGKIVGFVGDRINSRDPRAVVLTDKRFKWWLYKDLVVSEAAFKMFYADDKNRNKWYKPKTDDTK